MLRSVASLFRILALSNYMHRPFGLKGRDQIASVMFRKLNMTSVVASTGLKGCFPEVLGQVVSRNEGQSSNSKCDVSQAQRTRWRYWLKNHLVSCKDGSSASLNGWSLIFTPCSLFLFNLI